MSKMSPATRKSLKSRTRLVYAGREPADQHGFVNTPLYRGSTVLSPTVDHLYAREGFIYGTRGSPTMRALEEAWSELSGAAGTILLPSGLAAIAMALLAVVKAGDDILVTDSVYRPARQFCDTVLKRMGVATRYFDPAIGGGDCGADPAPYQRGYYRKPGIAKFRDAGYSSHCRRRPRGSAGHLRDDGQHLGDAAAVSAA